MAASQVAESSATSSAALAVEMDRVHARIVAELSAAGVSLPEEVVVTIAESVLADAIRLALMWTED